MMTGEVFIVCLASMAMHQQSRPRLCGGGDQTIILQLLRSIYIYFTVT